MFRVLPAVLGLLSLAVARPADVSSLDKRDALNPPRSLVYVQTFKTTSGGQLSLLPLIQQQTQVTHVILAATHINDPPGSITLNDNSPNDTVWDTVWSEAAQLQQNGVKVMMMLGGAAAGSYPKLCSGNVINDDYYLPLMYTLKYHNIDGLDLDIEESVDGSCPLALLQRLYQDFGNQFILTMAPVASDLQPSEQGLGGFSYSQLDAAATASDKPNGKLVNWYNTQFYNGWGDSSSPQGYQDIINNGYSPDRVVLGVLDNSNDGGSGWYSIGTYQNTINSLKATYSNFGGDVGWEYWDAGAADNLSDPWMWVQQISSTIFGSSAQNNVKTAVHSHGASPWPDHTETLKSHGVEHLQAIKALNVSGGDIDAAKTYLGLSKPLPINA